MSMDAALVNSVARAFRLNIELEATIRERENWSSQTRHLSRKLSEQKLVLLSLLQIILNPPHFNVEGTTECLTSYAQVCKGAQVIDSGAAWYLHGDYTVIVGILTAYTSVFNVALTKDYLRHSLNSRMRVIPQEPIEIYCVKISDAEVDLESYLNLLGRSMDGKESNARQDVQAEKASAEAWCVTCSDVAQQVEKCWQALSRPSDPRLEQMCRDDTATERALDSCNKRFATLLRDHLGKADDMPSAGTALSESEAVITLRFLGSIA